MNTQVTTEKSQTLIGPGGITLNLEAEAFLIAEPGSEGTGFASMVVIGDSAVSFWFATATGYVGNVRMTPKQVEWMTRLESAVSAWETEVRAFYAAQEQAAVIGC